MQLTWKPNNKHVTLLKLIRECDQNQDLTRAGILTRAILLAKEQTEEDWRETVRSLATLPKLDLPIPTAMVVQLDDSLAHPLSDTIEPAIRRALDLQILRRNYLITLLLARYYSSLGPATREVKERTDMDASEMIKRLSQCLSEAEAIANQIRQLLESLETRKEENA